ncbi:uncharacterized protein C8Q71DRAFT_725004 [Rhodofomes roseus]|uniref:XPG-I domain-containing protein n=1 Tax=Rhodofomes roseus TaxID=34475 RepID=A0ABQ8KAV6_9APHY|nr:uncharacterized protein C8Q71DRAFT_725004 [Rhodofomes roseus]KAH9834404.1 hypothetical protein C8Q71DRAFT_725004 [Rhodofomes roseus]
MGLTGRRREASLRCALLANLARHVPNLESLRMYDFDWTGLVLAMETAGMMNPVHASEAPGGARPARESGSAAHSIPYFPQLKSLHISSCASSIIATGEAVVRFLAAFPQLYALDIAFMPTMEASRSVYPPDRAMAQAWGADASPCVRIHELRLDTSTWAASPALDWLARPMVELDLHKLDIDLFCPWEPTSRLAELLYGRECAMLEDLAFSVSHEDGSQLKELRLIVQVYHAMREGNARELADWDALNNAILFLGRRCPKLVVVLDCEFDFVPPTDNFKRYTARCMRDRYISGWAIFMGVAGLWDILRPTGEIRSLTHLSVVDGFEANPDGVRGFRVGIDASIWFYHAAYGREGENPELRTLFFKCTRLMSAPFLPLFVFDGPKRPEVKRGKRISGKNHWMIQGMQEIINAFGFEWRMAPGEAEAELAYLNQMGVIDAVYTDDVDTFLFGAKMIIRNASVTLSGNRAHSLKNSAGREDGNHVATYTSHAILTHSSVQLTQGGLILIGILRGGDYHQAGLAGCGGTIAHGLARCGFGDTLLTAARSLQRSELPSFLRGWREEIRAELRTNSRGILGKKYAALAKKIPEDFPNIDVLLSYTNPITSESEAAAKGRVSKSTKIDWEKEPDLGKIAGLCEMYFEWGVKEIIIKRFRTVLWPAAVLRILRRVALLEDKRVARVAARTAVRNPTTPTKKGKANDRRVPGTPSSVITKHFSSLQLGSPKRVGRTDSDSDDDDENKLIVKIHSSRQHASTDGILEYRLEVAPAHLVRLSESGVRGLRTALATGLDDDSDVPEDDDSDDGGKGKKRVPKPPPDPQSHLRIWLPACMVRIAQPDLVEEFEGIQEMRAAKKAGKAGKASGTARGSKAKASTIVGAKPKAGKKVPVAVREEEEESSDGSVSPTPKKARPKVSAAKQTQATVAVPGVKQHFAVGKRIQSTSNSGKAKSSTAKIFALFDEDPPAPKRAASKSSSSSRIFDSDSEQSFIRPTASSSRLPSLTNSSRASSAGPSLSEPSSSEKPDLPRRTFVPAPFPMSFDAANIDNGDQFSVDVFRAGIVNSRAKRRSSRDHSPRQQSVVQVSSQVPKTDIATQTGPDKAKVSYIYPILQRR